jgi:hypothetical protein
MDDSPTPADITMIEITIKRVIDAEGKLAMMIKLPPRFSSIEVFGLLEAAKVYITREMIAGNWS